MANKKYTDRELMQMTIDEMNKSINEPRPDGKVPPKVGALLLFPDGRIEKHIEVSYEKETTQNLLYWNVS